MDDRRFLSHVELEGASEDLSLRQGARGSVKDEMHVLFELFEQYLGPHVTSQEVRLAIIAFVSSVRKLRGVALTSDESAEVLAGLDVENLALVWIKPHDAFS